jgi:hypothetical protein
MKKLLIVAFLIVSTMSFAQSGTAALNNYKYAVVPSQFSFLTGKDKYSLNTYTKMFMEKYGFTVFFDNDTFSPEAADQCSRIYVDLLENKNMFITKINVVLKDCLGNVLYTSETGSSKQKDYQTSYREALRKAFDSFDTLGYKYNGTGNGIQNPALAKKAEITKTAPEAPVEVDKNTLFAQPVENGYQLIDTTPAVVFKLRKTSSSDVFIAEKGAVSGTLIRKNNGWTFEYYVDGKLTTEQVKIKF